MRRDDGPETVGNGEEVEGEVKNGVDTGWKENMIETRRRHKMEKETGWRRRVRGRRRMTHAVQSCSHPS